MDGRQITNIDESSWLTVTKPSLDVERWHERYSQQLVEVLQDHGGILANERTHEGKGYLGCPLDYLNLLHQGTSFLESDLESPTHGIIHWACLDSRLSLRKVLIRNL